MKNTMMICLALFAAFGCTGQSKAGKGKTQELTTMENQKEIYLAGGCFWGTEHFMKQIRGVEATQVGYQWERSLRSCRPASGRSPSAQPADTRR